jgi:hypothetical protein
MIRNLVRIPGLRRLWSLVPVGSVAVRTEYDIWERPAYAYGIYRAAELARGLGLKNMSVIELGVAGGNGLVFMEQAAEEIGRHFGLAIDVYGLDTGTGMPPPNDYRDLPHVWREGFYRMEPDKLRERLNSATLLLGDVAATIPDLLSRGELAPVGFVAFDLDYYSSTKRAFQLLEGRTSTRLPRVYCYFDDTIGPERACHSEYTGELCAIREFNSEHDLQKIAKISNLGWMRCHAASWNEAMYVFHDFTHPLYTQLMTPSGDQHRQLALK